MANRLKMAEAQAIIVLAQLGWSQRRIAAEVGVDRGTVSRHVRAARAQVASGDGAEPNAATVITGSVAIESGDGGGGANAATPITGSGGGGEASPAVVHLPPASQRSRCEPLRDVILAKLEQGLTARRIWQDLRDEHAFADGYQSVQRFVRRLGGGSPLPFRRLECAPGEEAQVDFGRGAPIVKPDGKRTRPHLFRIVLSCSRKAYSEVVARQTTEEFLRCLENAFRHFGGVPRTIVPDNLKAAVLHADWCDPELNPKILAFCAYYGTVCLPTRPRTPRHKGKVERGVGYAQSNALKCRTFASLAEQNRFLAEWEASVADTRIHGTTRRQVGPYFAEAEKPALLPLPGGAAERFPFFHEAQRIVNRDGHVEVARAYYSALPEFVGRTVWARWDGRVVRLFDERLTQIAIHPQHEPGRFATDDRHIAPQKRSGLERGAAWWLRRADTVGTNAGHWAEAVVTQRGVHALRAVMGLVGLTKLHRDADVDRACRIACGGGAWRLRDVRNLLKRQNPPEQERFEFTVEHPLIRSLSDYGRLVHDALQEVHA